MSILVYSPINSESDHICDRLSRASNQVPGLDVTRITTADEFRSTVSTSLKVEQVVITYDESFDTIIESLQPVIDTVRMIVLANHDDIPYVQSIVGGHPVMPLPGTGYALRVMLSTDPANDPVCRLGEFQLSQLISYGRMTHTFAATQTSIDRPVFLHLLNHEHTQDQGVRQEFLEDIQAKAKANHGAIIPVFQAIDNGIQLYYTEEHLLCDTLKDRVDAGEQIDPMLAVRIARASSAALLNLFGLGVSSHQLEPEHIFLTPDVSDHCRIENTAFSGSMNEIDFVRNLHHFLPSLMAQIDTSAKHADAVISWLDRLIASGGNPAGLRDTTLSARKLLASIEGRTAAVATAEPVADASFVPKRSGGPGKTLPKTKSPALPIAIVAVIAAAIGIMVMIGSDNENAALPTDIDLEMMVKIEGGTHTRPNRGPAVQVETFWIDPYEVTISQYAEFLEFLEEHPEYAHLEHPNKPSSKTDHQPAGWATYHPIAVAGGTYKGHKITLHHPVFGVDWWDAYAYARWKDRRLVSEMEWEFAAMGEEGRKYPWGNQWKASYTNTGADSKDGSVDGAARTCAVYHPASDRTPDGVMGLAGNVSEWTATEVLDPSDPDLIIPVVKGGSFNAPEVDILGKSLPSSHSSKAPYVGFRTAAGRDPEL